MWTEHNLKILKDLLSSIITDPTVPLPAQVDLYNKLRTIAAKLLDCVTHD